MNTKVTAKIVPLGEHEQYWILAEDATMSHNKASTKKLDLQFQNYSDTQWPAKTLYIDMRRNETMSSGFIDSNIDWVKRMLKKNGFKFVYIKPRVVGPSQKVLLNKIKEMIGTKKTSSVSIEEYRPTREETNAEFNKKFKTKETRRNIILMIILLAIGACFLSASAFMPPSTITTKWFSGGRNLTELSGFLIVFVGVLALLVQAFVTIWKAIKGKK